MSDTLMISVSGMRGHVGTDLTPELVARYAAAFGAWVRESRSATAGGRPAVVLGRDSRTSGPMFTRAAASGLMSVGVDAIEVGMVPTPTVQMAVEHHHAGGGLILTASHNPIEWNALKFVGPDGIFLDAESGRRVRALAEQGPARMGWEGLGEVREDRDAIVAPPRCHSRAVNDRCHRDSARGDSMLRWIVSGAPAPGDRCPLLERLGCRVSGINLEPDGRFPRAPEPIPENLGELGRAGSGFGASIGFAVDPDVDRLALVDEKGRAIGEDYTLAFAIRSVLDGRITTAKDPTVVVNLSTSLVVEDAARSMGASFVRAPVGEANVARAIRDRGAVIGGEGNGGVMFPALHTGRDAPLGVALILHLLATTGVTVSQLVAAAPRYTIVKAKGPRGPELRPMYDRLKTAFPGRGSRRERWLAALVG